MENVNSALVDIHSLLVVSLVEGVVKYQRENKYLERQQTSNKWMIEGGLLTQFASQYDITVGSKVQKRTLEMVEHLHPKYRALVLVSNLLTHGSLKLEDQCG